jgi:hypothetical protein
MKLITWILIGLSILSLLFLHCPCEDVYENMSNADALSITNEYIQNLTDQRDAASKNATDTEIKVDETNSRLTNAKKLLDETTNVDERPARIDEVSAITAELTKYQSLVSNYQRETERFNSLIAETQARAGDLQKQVDNTPETATAPSGSDQTGVAFVAGPNDTMVALNPTGLLASSSIYYEPGAYKFGSSTYVPSYADSVYLSKTTGNYSVSTYLDQATIQGGACSYLKDQPLKLEEMCNSTDKNNCGAMSCCVLLGGAKCVSGDANGPYNKTNYGDITVRDKDYYYHTGKCYGNCN